MTGNQEALFTPFINKETSIPLRIVATGQYLPARVVESMEVDLLTGMPGGWTERHTGVERRHYADHVTAAGMASMAMREAMANSDWGNQAPDLLIGACGTPDQPIPCNASLMARELGWSGVPCFDVNATCLGFVVGLQVAGALLATKAHQRVAIACSEIASRGLNWKQPESAGLIGDGAAAVLVERDDSGNSALLRTLMETWPEGSGFAEIRGGGSRIPAREYRPGQNADDFCFQMNGPSLFRLAAEKMERFVARMVGEKACRWDGIDWVIPHQASLPAIRHLRRRLRIPKTKLIETIQQQGNVISASIPLALHEVIRSGRLQRGQTVLLLGTSAGFSLGAALLRY